MVVFYWMVVPLFNYMVDGEALSSASIEKQYFRVYYCSGSICSSILLPLIKKFIYVIAKKMKHNLSGLKGGTRGWVPQLKYGGLY